MFLNTTKLLY